MTPYAATITTDKYVACYKDGGMVVVRLKDGHSAKLDVRETLSFHDCLAWEFDKGVYDLREVADTYFDEHVKFEKRKWIVVRPIRTVIEIHNAPIAAKD